MAHIKTRIRDEVMTRLQDIPEAGLNYRVFEADASSLDDRELPAIAAYTPEEQVAIKNPKSISFIVTRNISLDIYIMATKPERVEDELDSIAMQIEKAVLFDPTLSDMINNVSLVSVNTIINTETSKPLGMSRLRFEAEALTNFGEPDQNFESNPSSFQT